MCIWGYSAYSNVLHPDGKWDDGKARMRKQLMILQIANRKANASTNDIPRTKQWSTCQSQLLGVGEEGTKIKSKYALHKHKYKFMTLLQKQAALCISASVPHSGLQNSLNLSSLNRQGPTDHPLIWRKRWALYPLP